MKKTKNQSNLIMAAAYIAIGILFIILKGAVISIAMTVIGLLLIAAAVRDFLSKDMAAAIVKAVVGIVVLVAGFAFVSIALYIMAAILLVLSLIELYRILSAKGKKKYLKILEPAVSVVIALILLFNQGGAVNWMFVFAGVLFVGEGSLILYNQFVMK